MRSSARALAKMFKHAKIKDGMLRAAGRGDIAPRWGIKEGKNSHFLSHVESKSGCRAKGLLELYSGTAVSQSCLSLRVVCLRLV